MGGTPVRISDRRRVDIDTAGPSLDQRPRLFTPSGRSPIAVSNVELRYDLSTGHLTSITARGYLVEERDIRRRELNSRAGGAITRRVSINWHTHGPEGEIPLWLLDMIEQYRPEGGPS